MAGDTYGLIQLMTAPKSETFVALQWLRAAAAIAVIVFHVADHLPSRGMIAGVPLGLPGAAGVDVFFCLSGFIMLTMSYRRRLTPLAFLRLRVIRIVPLYWLLTAALMLAVVLRPGWFPRQVLHLDHALTSFLFIPWRSPVDGLIAPFLSQGWTLNYEMFFYVVFAMCLLVPGQRRLQLLTAALLGLIGVGLVVQPANVAAKAFTHQLLLEFLAGAWVAYGWHQGVLRMSERKACGLLAAAVMALLTTAWLGPDLVDGLRALVWGVPAVGILIAALNLEQAARRGPHAGVLLGDASYAIYLVHGLAIAVVAKVWKLSPEAGVATSFVYVSIAMGAGILAGLACHWLVERPLAAWLTPSKVADRRSIPASPAQVF